MNLFDVPLVNWIVPSPATIEAFVIGLVIVTVPDLPSVHDTGKTTVAFRQCGKLPAQVDDESEIENVPFS
ncbi:MULTISPECIES: hypothetical protein [Rhizobium/Agrobacterium group]|uniref:hypothetical protein n=1 Tax=Rhizobium oryzihabitans TaxID=2267833 RepID=UPI004033E39C